MKSYIFSGNIGETPQVRTIDSGGATFITFGVAVHRRFLKNSDGTPIMENGVQKMETEWNNCQIYIAPDRDATKMIGQLTKGRHIMVTANPRIDVWIDKNNKEPQGKIVWLVNDIEF